MILIARSARKCCPLQFFLSAGPEVVARMIVGLDAGDWRRPDDEFAASFRAPPTRCDALRLRNPFPRESRIHFDEPSHTYTVDNKTVVPRSVTGFVHRYCNDFDPRLVIQQMQARPSWEWKQQEHLRPDGTVMSPEEIARKWERNGRMQRNRGTLHASALSLRGLPERAQD